MDLVAKILFEFAQLTDEQKEIAIELTRCLAERSEEGLKDALAAAHQADPTAGAFSPRAVSYLRR